MAGIILYEKKNFCDYFLGAVFSTINAVVVFIDRDINSLATDDRPLSVNLPALYEKRLPMYRDFAHIKVDGNLSPEDVAKKITEGFSEVI